MSAVQLPHDIRGEALCRHQQPGGCTWWCSYRRGVLCIGPVFAGFVAVGVAVWTTGGEDARARVSEALMGAAILIVVTVPLVMYLNARDTD
ncbi:putative anti-sigma-YlaC factor YlaD [Saccharothrix ecbatanensis]|uniref:Putative anti-sigma-YlaC factor YlaD n=1 Tax=Saccharothrix ecbatanensis TaxID=1105145 RepID=A0A7W9M0F2_9PSEU|nr:hypothetical protein [Saccharothrix ecbatanensis]MBB5802900.1 putative anti-sigma-YlaC factor YlaD [Saccharothrix ecbatanensis]